MQWLQTATGKIFKPHLRMVMSLMLPYLAIGLLLSITLLPINSEVEVFLRVDHLSFDVGAGRQHNLVSGQDILGIGVLHHGAITFGVGKIEGTDQLSISNELIGERKDLEWTITPGPAADPLWFRGTDAKEDLISLNHLVVVGDTRVTVSMTDGPDTKIVLDVDDPKADAQVGVKQRVAIHCSYCRMSASGVAPRMLGNAVLVSKNPHLVTIPAGEAGFTIILEFPQEQQLIDVPLPVWRELHFSDLLRGARLSSVSGGGHILLPELSRRIEVKPRQIVALGDLKDLKIISLVATPASLEVTLAGTVGVLCTGYASACVSHIPSILEWLHARDKWLLYMSGVVLLGGMLVATLARIRKGTQATGLE